MRYAPRRWPGRRAAIPAEREAVGEEYQSRGNVGTDPVQVLGVLAPPAAPDGVIWCPAMSGLTRFQLTLFVPAEIAESVDDIRRRWDPIMAARVAPHITVLYAVENVAELRQHLGGIAEFLCRFRVRLGPVDHWGRPEDGIFITVEDSDGAIEALRSRTSHLRGPDDMSFTPHVTLLHPRTVPPQDMVAAWTQLRDLDPIEEVVISEVSIIGESNAGWVVTDNLRLP